MPSTLSWLDHDPSGRDRMLRVLALFRERDTRDELGIGGIRDSLSDRLFPGTSTIQTRLRYFLFVPWIYQAIEREGVRPARAGAEARAREIALMTALGDEDDLAGIFGKLAGGELKRLAASVYWSGLGSWGIRHYPGSIQEYHADLEAIRQRRRRVRSREDGSTIEDPGATTWHPRLPAAPEGFPTKATIGVTREEAQFIREQFQQRHPETLLAHLMQRVERARAQAEAPWLHPDYAGFRTGHKILLEHGRLLADLVYGAAVLYNLLLARVGNKEQIEEARTADLARWTATADLEGLGRWKLDTLWMELHGGTFAISSTTRAFVSEWLKLVGRNPGGLAADAEAQRLIQRREGQLKGARSRFVNRRALEQWGGRAGMVRLHYRWQVVQQLLTDMRQGLLGNEPA